MGKKKFSACWEKSQRIWDLLKKIFVPEWLIRMGCWWEQTRDSSSLLNNPVLGEQGPELSYSVSKNGNDKHLKRWRFNYINIWILMRRFAKKNVDTVKFHILMRRIPISEWRVFILYLFLIVYFIILFLCTFCWHVRLCTVRMQCLWGPEEGVGLPCKGS